MWTFKISVTFYQLCLSLVDVSWNRVSSTLACPATHYATHDGLAFLTILPPLLKWINSTSRITALHLHAYLCHNSLKQKYVGRIRKCIVNYKLCYILESCFLIRLDQMCFFFQEDINRNQVVIKWKKYSHMHSNIWKWLCTKITAEVIGQYTCNILCSTYS